MGIDIWPSVIIILLSHSLSRFSEKDRQILARRLENEKAVRSFGDYLFIGLFFLTNDPVAARLNLVLGVGRDRYAGGV